jgi:ferredoxin
MPAKVDNNRCTGCEACLESCPSEAIKMDSGKAKIDRDTCVDCAVCVGECPVEAIGME